MLRLCVVIALLAGSIPAASLDEKVRRVENGLQRAVTIKGQPVAKAAIAERLKHFRVPGVSVAVLANGEIEWARGYGLTSAEAGRPVDAETLFQAASISKPVAAMTALRLVELGKLSLDEDVNVKLRSWKVPESDLTKTQKVTLRRLLSHTAGLTVHGFPGYAAGAPVPTLRQLLDGAAPANTAAIRPDIPPGTRMRYSGGGYEVMQLLVEDVTGRAFPDVARELVLAPLGMTRSTYEQPLPERYRANAASAHRSDGGVVKGRWHTYPEMAAAGLWTTPSDLLRFAREIQRPGKVLKTATVKEMLTGALGGNYGLGLSLGNTEGRASFSHGGANEGFRAMLFAYRDGGSGAAVMTNADRGSELASEILRSIAVEYGWPDYRPREKAVANVSAEILRSYAGRYRIPDGPVITVTASERGLRAETPGRPVDLLPESDTSFFSPEGAAPDFKFAKLPDGSVQLTAGGASMKRM